MSNGIHMQHLTDAEFSRLLDGAEPGPSTAAHLALCEFCREELETVQSALGDFRGLSTTWAEMEAHRRIAVPARWLATLQRQRSWATGLVATTATGVLAFWLAFAPQAHQAAVQHKQIAAPSSAELAADNRLLLSIDTELSDQAQPMVSPAALQITSRPSVRHAVGVTTD